MARLQTIFTALTVLVAILILWTLAVVPMNAHLAADMAARGDQVITPGVG